MIFAISELSSTVCQIVLSEDQTDPSANPTWETLTVNDLEEALVIKIGLLEPKSSRSAMERSKYSKSIALSSGFLTESNGVIVIFT